MLHPRPIRAARFLPGLINAGRALAAALLLAAPALAAPTAAVPAQAAPLAPAPCSVVVLITDDSGNHSLRDAVACAVYGGTVLISGLTNQTITLTSGEIPITQTMTIDASDSPGVKVDAGNNSRVFNIAASGTVTLTGLTLQRGHTNGNGGALFASQDVVLNQVQVLSSTATGTGGGLYAHTATLSGTQFISNTAGSSAGGAWVTNDVVVSGGRFERNLCTGGGCQGGALNVNGLTVSGTQFLTNTSQAGAGAVFANNPATLTNALLQGNQCEKSDCQGGGVFVNASLTLSGTQLIGNHSGSNGGGAFADGVAQLTNSLFQDNHCTGGGCQGGGLNTFELTLTGTQFISNTSLSNGGGVSASGAAELNNGLFQGNRCDDDGCLGGGLYADTLTLTGTQLISNTSGGGGGAYVGNTAVLLNGRFQGNQCQQASCQGGGLNTFELTLTGTQFISNSSSSGGGGVFILGTGQVADARFEGNGCTESGCRGAGLYANTTGSVRNSSFSSNHAGGRGGGAAGTALTLANVTLSDNSADVAGGALFALSGSALNLYNVTVANNQAPAGGGLLAEAGATVDIRNTIFANNSSGNCSGPIGSGTHNLEWPNTDCADAGGSAVGFSTADPQLLPLALNAPGATLTRALGPASAARDAGAAVFCAAAPVNNVDQRGVPRPIDGDAIAGAICDIGAFEAAAPVWELFLPLVRR